MIAMMWRIETISGSDLANEPELNCDRTYQPGELPLPTRPQASLKRMHTEVEMHTDETMEDIMEMRCEVNKVRKELWRTREDRDTKEHKHAYCYCKTNER